MQHIYLQIFLCQICDTSLRQLEASLVRRLVVVMMARGIARSSRLVFSLFWHGRAVLSGVLRSNNAVSVALNGQSINHRDAHLAEETANGDFAENILQLDAY